MVNSPLTKKTYKVIRKGIHTANHLRYKPFRRRINWRKKQMSSFIQATPT